MNVHKAKNVLFTHEIIGQTFAYSKVLVYALYVTIEVLTLCDKVIYF